MVGSSLARRIRRVRRVRRDLGEEAVRAERAEHLVGGDVQEAKPRASLRRERAPVAQRFLQEGEGADDVGLNEVAWTIDRTIDMAFGRQMHHRVRLVFLEQLAQRRSLANALFFERVVRVAVSAGQRLEAGGIGQLVDINHAGMGVAQ